jgi:uncharacterized membrane protein
MQLTPRTHRIVQTVLNAALAVGYFAPVLSLVFGQASLSALGLMLTISLIALAWNHGFTEVFERWEARQTVKGRSWRRRLAHGTLFEGSLDIMVATLRRQPVSDIGILLFFWPTPCSALGRLTGCLDYHRAPIGTSSLDGLKREGGSKWAFYAHHLPLKSGAFIPILTLIFEI